MKILLALTCLAASCLLAGCAAHGPRPAAAPASARDVTAVAPAQFGPAPAKITLVNNEYKFVVIDFTSRAMPPIGTELSVYRAGKRIGALRISEPVRARFATADVLEGDVQTGDEAR